MLAIGTRLQDFTTGSRTLFAARRKLVALNVQAFDAAKHGGVALVADARDALVRLDAALRRLAGRCRLDARARRHWRTQWNERVTALTTHEPPASCRPTPR